MEKNIDLPNRIEKSSGGDVAKIRITKFGILSKITQETAVFDEKLFFLRASRKNHFLKLYNMG